MAIGALDQTCSASHDHRKRSLDTDQLYLGCHHQDAIRLYARAISTMKKDVAEGRQDLKTTLLTCIIITIFESFHGNYILADAQINNGIELLRTWHFNHPKQLLHPMGFSSPAPSVVDDGLVQLFGRLELQRFSFDDTRPIEIHRQYRDGGREMLNKMPERFSTLYQARMYLDLVMRRAKHWSYIIGTTYKPSKLDSSDERSSLPLVGVGRSTHESFSELKEGGEFPDVSNIRELERQRHIHLRDLHLWSVSFEAFLRQSLQKKDTVGSTILRLAFQTTNLVIGTACLDNTSKLRCSPLPNRWRSN
jgi:hypothetical protein